MPKYIPITEQNKKHVIQQLGETTTRSAQSFAKKHNYNYEHVIKLIKEIDHSFNNPLNEWSNNDNLQVIKNYIKRNPGANQQDLIRTFNISRPTARKYIQLIYTKPYTHENGTYYGSQGEKRTKRIITITQLIKDDPHLSLQDIVDLTNIPYNVVYRIIQDYKLTRLPNTNELQQMTTKKLQELLDTHAGKSRQQLANDLGWSKSTIDRLLKNRPDVTFHHSKKNN